MSNPQTIAASEARNNFSDLVSKVQYKGEVFLIERYGEVVAKIVPVEKVEAKSETEEKPELATKPIEQKPNENREDWKQKLDEQLKQMNRMSSLHNPHRQVYTPPTQNKDADIDAKVDQNEQLSASISQPQQNEQSVKTEQKNDSGWSALKKLEELIAAQRVKATHQSSTTSEQPEKTEQDYVRNEQPIAGQTAQNYQSQQIIRKKIEL